MSHKLSAFVSVPASVPAFGPAFGPAYLPASVLGSVLVPAFALCLTLTLTLTGSDAVAEVVLQTQERSGEVTGFVEGPQGTDQDSNSDSFDGPGPYGLSVAVDLDTEGAATYASSYQNSFISTDYTSAQGLAGTRGESTHPDGVALAAAESRFVFTFEVVVPQAYLLSGIILADGDAITVLELSGPEGTVDEFEITGTSLPIGVEGILMPGSYTLFIESSASAAGGGQVTAVSSGLYEVGILFEDADPADAPVLEPTPVPSLRVWPNPAFAEANLELSEPLRTNDKISVHDANGRKIREWNAAAGTRNILWDMKDGAGDRVSPGVYFVRLDSGGDIAKAIVVR